MACFLVPTAEAIVTGVVSNVEKKNEVAVEGKIPFSRKLKWLKNMLWGGAALLAAAAIFYVVNYPASVSAAAAARQLPIYSVERSQKVCSISFDAAWGDAKVRQLSI